MRQDSEIVFKNEKMGSGISPEQTKQQREKQKAQHILKTFDFNKLFHPRAVKPRNTKSEVHNESKPTTPQVDVFCEKCGSPTNMTNIYLKAPSERLQSAPVRAEHTPLQQQQRHIRFDNDIKQAHPQVSQLGYSVNVPRAWEDQSFLMNQTSPLYLN